MAQFIGKWKGDASGYTNFEAFAKASGCPNEVIEKFKNSINIVEFKKNGDEWAYEMSSDVHPPKTYKFKSGDEVTNTDVFGKQTKCTITIVSDSKMTQIEKTEMLGWKTIKTVREVKDGKLIDELELEDGTKMTEVKYRCS